jgi:hypothetical protein
MIKFPVASQKRRKKHVKFWKRNDTKKVDGPREGKKKEKCKKTL